MNPYVIEKLMNEQKAEAERISKEGWKIPRRKKHLRLFSILKQAIEGNKAAKENQMDRECTNC